MDPIERAHTSQRSDAGSAQQLDPDKIVETVDALARRIEERFPGAGLNRVCRQLLDIALQAKVRARQIAEPMVWLRFVTWSLVSLFVIGFAITIYAIHPQQEKLGIADLVQMLEAGVNFLLLIGATIVFVVTLDARVKRRRAVMALHELRVIAHIIDMHQLTKDPERAVVPDSDTPSSPKRSLGPFELNRYLDYCSEMLALCGKIAALYAQRLVDPAVLDAANDIENLTSDLARKIWQKIIVLQNSQGRESLAARTPNLPASDGERPA